MRSPWLEAGKGHGRPGADAEPVRRSPVAVHGPARDAASRACRRPPAARQRSAGHGPQPRSHPRPTSLATGVPSRQPMSAVMEFHVRFYQCPVTRATAAGLSVSARRLSEPDSGSPCGRRGEFPLPGDSAGRNPACCGGLHSSTHHLQPPPPGATCLTLRAQAGSRATAPFQVPARPLGAQGPGWKGLAEGGCREPRASGPQDDGPGAPPAPAQPGLPSFRLRTPGEP